MPYKCSNCSVLNSKYDFSWNSYLNHLWALGSNKFWRTKKWFAHFWIFARYIVQHKEIKKEANFPPSKCTLWLYMYFHSSEIRCLCLIKCSIETLKKMKKKWGFFYFNCIVNSKKQFIKHKPVFSEECWVQKATYLYKKQLILCSRYSKDMSPGYTFCKSWYGLYT